MTSESKHISVCICTYRRPHLLKRLLDELGRQDTEGLFTYSIVVAENDHLQSAKAVVADFAAASAIPIRYCVEPRQNIALARNKAIANASGNFVAFIDDDEFPTKQWLLLLFKTCNQYNVDGVLGPVMPYFDKDVPSWVVKGGFFDRPRHRTGQVLDVSQTRTGNVLLRSQLFANEAQPFQAECLAGSDMVFFGRMIHKGRVFVWCNEAVVYEVVPPARWKRSFLIRRNLFRGGLWLRNCGFSPLPVAVSLLAVPAYAATLPLALVVGQARFMRYLSKLSYHLGRLLALLGINPIKEYT